MKVTGMGCYWFGFLRQDIGGEKNLDNTKNILLAKSLVVNRTNIFFFKIYYLADIKVV